MRPPARFAAALALPLLALQACSSDDPTAVAVAERAAPVLLADGQPSVARATGAEVVERFEFRPGDARWRVLTGVATPAAEALGQERAAQLELAGVHLAPQGEKPPRVLLEGLAWSADDVGTVVVRAAVEAKSQARLWFRTSADEARYREKAPDDAAGLARWFPRENVVQVPTRWSYRPEELVFDVAAHPAWSGTVTAIELDLLWQPRTVMLEDLEARGHGIVPGAAPIVVDGVAQDAGLLTLEWEDPDDPHAAVYEARRAYPALAGEPQVLRRDPGRSAVLSYALPHAYRVLRGPVRFEVEAVALDAAGKPARSGAPLFSAELDPATDGGRWLHAELPAGDEAGLLLRTTGGAPDGRVNGLWGPFCQSPAGERPTSVVLITADTLRADHVGAFGAADVETPVMDALAARGVAFLDALATSNATSPSHASILTGLYPRDHRVTSNSRMLPAEVVSLAERMRASGRVTIASSSVRHLNAGLSGLGQGFDFYAETPPTLPGPGGNLREAYRSAAQANRVLADTMQAVGDAPFFLWVHYYDPHTPYDPEPDFRERYTAAAPAATEGDDLITRFARDRMRHAVEQGLRKPEDADLAKAVEEFRRTSPHLGFLGDERSAEHVRALYRAEVAQLDRDLGALLSMLGLDAPRDDALIVLTADHGEGLGERDVWFDHEGLYANTLHVPLIFAGAGVPSGARIDAPVTLVDVVPTVCELADVAPPRPLAGVSLVGAMRGADLGDRMRWFLYASEQEVGFRSADRHFLLSLLGHGRGALDHHVPAGAVELYDVARDPALASDVSGEEPDEAERAAELARDWLERRLIQAEDQRAELSGADREALGALGYAGDDE
jgi:arylsulfatase A-like enzyme